MKKLLLPLLISSSTAIAGPFTSSDARSMAMGDTGVASASAGTAGIFNPALLSSFSGDNNRFSVILPNIGVNAFASEDTIDAFQDIEDNDYGDRISSAVTAINNAIAQGSPAGEADFDTSKVEFQSVVDEFNGKLSDISGEPLTVNGNAIFSVSRQGRNLGFSVFANANAAIETALDISSCDTGLLGAIADTVASSADIADLATSTDSYNCTATGNSVDFVQGGDLVNPDDELNSAIDVALVATSELGVSLSSKVELAGLNLAVGITPKILTVTTQYVKPSLQTLDDNLYDLGDDLEAHEEEESDFNLDIGVATRLLGDSLTVGVVAKNLVSQSYKTASYTTEYDNAADVTTQQSIDIDPQLRAGVAWQVAGLTLAADMDLTENKGYLDGNDSQYLAVGLEYNALNVIRLRTGMRSNLSEADDTALSAGIGFNIVAAHFDLGLQSSDNNAAVALQFGVEF